MKDYYQILEVEPDASQEQIKSQYRFLVQGFHPDKYASAESKAKAEEKLKQINEAFSILKDPVKRGQYDQERLHAQKMYDDQMQNERERKQREKEAREKAEANRRQKEQAEAQRREYEAKAQREAKEKAERERAKRAEEEQAARAKGQREAEEKSKSRSASVQQPLISDRKPAIGTTAAKSSQLSLWQVAPLIVLGFFALFLGGLGAKVFSTISPATSTATKTVLVMPLATIEIPVIATKTPIALTELPIVTTEIPLAIKDGFLAASEAKMIFIPEGEFLMGSDDKEARKDEKPLHQIFLSSYYIDQYEVTNADYKRCVDVGACNLPAPSTTDTYQSKRATYYGNPEFDSYPVMYVNWNMATTYCSWRNARLPTEAEWEKAARGTKGYTYPWGNSGFDCSLANYFEFSEKGRSCTGDTTKVGIYESGKSPYGLYDMIGNVYEWVSDWYDENYYQHSPLQNPLGPDSNMFLESNPLSYRVVRGGSGNIYDEDARVSSRNYLPPNYAIFTVGFRCASSP